jgi:hypothetical protein
MSDPQPSPPLAADSDASAKAVGSRGIDRRKNVVDVRTSGALERRRGPGRRRSDFMRAAEDGHMTREQFLFVSAIDAYKRANDTPFPTWTEVLEVIRKLGYRKTCVMTFTLDNAEDWTEAPDAAPFPPNDPDVAEPDPA